MTTPITFYFDFSSPYGYLASERIEAIATRFGRQVDWRPILLSVVFKETGGTPLIKIPFKGEYSLRDFARSARFMNVPYTHPTHFPVSSKHAARTYYWLQEHHPAQAVAFLHATYRAYFSAGQDISNLDTVLDLAVAQGADRAALNEALAGQALKERLQVECATALQKGVFGSPFMFVDGEAFFGADRLPQIEHWLATGGF